MKEKIIFTVLLMVSISSGFTIITVLFVIIPWWGFSFLVFLAFLRFLILKADKYHKNITPKQQKLLDDLDMEFSRSVVKNQLLSTKPKPELLQVAEMYRDDMQGSPAEGSLAYMATVKAIDNYYKTKNVTL